ncbi:MAG: hypothetical protein H0W90_13775 [Actinobacteria bacterium]|nr:hypothetical protein [Actinomycetota bacterium]
MEVVARRTADAAAFARAGSEQRIAVARAVLDCALLAAVIGISTLPYVRGLGFYYDDYSVLAQLNGAHDQSLIGLYHAVRPLNGQRPLQSLTFAALYRLFGLNPLGYHVVNAFLFVAVAWFLYLVLRELRLPRLVCVALPLVYSILPHYATNRFWLDAFQITVSNAFYLLSLYAGLRALRARPAAIAGWLILAAAAVAGSVFAYEVVFPLFALEIGLLWWAARRAPRPVPVARWLTIGGLASAIVVVGVIKATLVAEHGQNGYQVGFQDGLAHHLAYLVSGSIKLNAGSYLLAVPYVLWWIIRHRLTAANAGAAGAAGLLAFGYVWWIGRRDREALMGARTWRDCVRVGLIAFVLGYAIFLTNRQVLFRSAGIDNRVNAAAALGVAAILVGAIGWIAGRLTEPRGIAFYSASVGCIVATGVLIIATLGSFWTSAAKEQHAIVSSLQRTAPSLPLSSTVVLDSVCPEIGPAVVFADQWDLRGALALAYHDPSLAADAATEDLRAGSRRLELEMTFLGGRSTRTYAYDPHLFVYDFPRRTLHVLRDQSEAAGYVSSERPSFKCPPQRSFAWGFDPSRRLSLP